MPSRKIYSSLCELATSLHNTDKIVADFETSGVDPRCCHFAGLGVYIPSYDKVFYINMGHFIEDEDYPRYPVSEVATVLSPFFANPSNTVIAHNAPYEVRLFMRMNLPLLCRMSDTLVWTHRCDENYISDIPYEATTHELVTKVGYGLKTLMTILYGIKPPKLNEVTEGLNALDASPSAVAYYCSLDCLNTWTLYKRARKIIRKDPTLERLIENFDDAHIVPHAKMMLEGFCIDQNEVTRQMEAYESGIKACVRHLREITGYKSPIATPAQIRKFLRSQEWPHSVKYHSILQEKAEIKRSNFVSLYHMLDDNRHKLIIGLLLQMRQMKQRIDSYLRPFSCHHSLGRQYFTSFMTTLTSTRYRCSPNLHGFPGKSDAMREAEPWQQLLPEECAVNETTRDILVAPEGQSIVAFDLSAAEPRYLAINFQKYLTEGSQALYERKRELSRNRARKWPDLMRKMKALQKPFEGTVSASTPPSYTEDPLWVVFKYPERGDCGGDPYNAFLIAMDPDGYNKAVADSSQQQWLKTNRWKGKLGFLALAYGSTENSLSQRVGCTVDQMRKALWNLEKAYPTLDYLREDTLLQILHTGQVRSLYGRPRRINGYYHLLNTLEPLRVGFHRRACESRRNYEADIIVLGTIRQGVQIFLKKCWVVYNDHILGTKRRRLIFEADNSARILQMEPRDVFLNADHFNQLPFRNLSYRSIDWVQTPEGLVHNFAEQERCTRQAFNARCQTTGADQLREIIVNLNREVINHGFEDCRLWLTVHDSLEFFVPDNKVDSFVATAWPVITRPPSFFTEDDPAQINFKVECEVGKRFGSMTRYDPFIKVERSPVTLPMRIIRVMRSLIRTLKHVLYSKVLAWRGS